jgi:hypothetical protein
MSESGEIPPAGIDHPQDLRAIVTDPDTGEALLMIVYTGTAVFSLGSLGDDATFATLTFPVPDHNGNCQAYPSPLQVRASVAVGSLTAFDADDGGLRACDWVTTELRSEPGEFAPFRLFVLGRLAVTENFVLRMAYQVTVLVRGFRDLPSPSPCGVQVIHP